MKKKYITPTLDVETVQLEHSIAAGSATVTPINNSNEVYQEWETKVEDERDFYW